MRKFRWSAGPITAALVACALTSLGASPARAASSCDTAAYPSLQWVACEAANYATTGQNSIGRLNLLPGLMQGAAEYQAARLAKILKDHERQPNPNTCTTIVLCPVDPRVSVAGWRSSGGLVSPVLYTSRSGATMSGHVWGTVAGAAKRPAVVIINGSVFGFQEAYWYLAQTLAVAGFVVMSFDPQGEGMSDQFGEKPDQLEDAFSGTPGVGILQPTKVTGDVLGGNGLPFYDGGQDALDFFLSTPAHPYVPRASRSTGTSHDAKQVRRVKAGRNNAYNPLWSLVDSSKVGLTGHSYGAEASSWLAQADPRVDAAVALDSLCVPSSPSPDEVAAVGTINPELGGPGIAYGLPKACFGAPNGPTPAITKPVLGIAADYLIMPTPYVRPPNPLAKARASQALSAAGVDTGQIVLRGGTHLDFNDVPVALPATFRGIDLVAWYTQAWFRKYLLDDPGADAMLLTQRWRNDASTGTNDPRDDSNMMSWHFRSRLDIRLTNGSKVACEDLRAGCAALVPATVDGGPATYSAFLAANTP